MLPSRLTRFLSLYGAEAAIVLVGVMLRLSMRLTYHVEWGYDAMDHALASEWHAHHFGLTPVEISRAAYHPPLYYTLAGGMKALGFPLRTIALLSPLAGCGRLLILWAGLVRWVADRRARVVALALAAVMPSSVHLDGMLSNEGLNGLVAAAAIYAGARLLEHDAPRPSSAMWVGVLCGLGLLTKISAIATVGALVLAALLGLGWAGGARRRFALTLALVIGIPALMISPYVARNLRVHHEVLVSGFDHPSEARRRAVSLRRPYWERRPIDYYIGWDGTVLRHPYWPAGTMARSHFWPVLIASSFVDYYNASFAPATPAGPIPANGKPIEARSYTVSRWSAAGGCVLALCAILAWLAAMARCGRLRHLPGLALLLQPAFALAGQLHFATQFPADTQGIVKGLYMQFAACPLYALVGLAFAWLVARGRIGRVGAAMLVGAIACVAAYTLWCRVLFYAFSA